MNNTYVTINNHKIELPNGAYADRNAQQLLLAGHVLHAISNKDEPSSCEFNTSKVDSQKIIDELTDTECWLIPTIKAIGELIAAVDREEIEDGSLNNIGYLIATLTELLYRTQYIQTHVKSCVNTDKEGLS